MILVLGYTDWEGPQLLGLYSSKERAVEAIIEKYPPPFYLRNADIDEIKVYRPGMTGCVCEFELRIVELDRSLMPHHG